MSTRASTFDKALRETAVTALSAHGFRFDGGRTFRQLSEDHRTCRIIDFQLGQRSMAGKFIVNLGVFAEGDSLGVSAAQANEYDCRFERRMRIGTLIPNKLHRLASLPFIGFLFGSADRWWAFSNEPDLTTAAVAAAVDKVTAHGFAWFSTTGP